MTLKSAFCFYTEIGYDFIYYRYISNLVKTQKHMNTLYY